MSQVRIPTYFIMFKYYANSSVSIVMGYGLEGPGSISDRGKALPILHSVQATTGTHATSYPVSIGGSLPAVKGARV
jgi:hypothetical protein